MTYGKPRDLYDVIVTYISQSLHCMTSSTATGLPRMCTLYHYTERRVHRCVCGQGDIEHHHQQFDSVYKQGKNYHTQAHVEECKYTDAENQQCNMLSDDDDDDDDD